jgi:hypothetical protein
MEETSHIAYRDRQSPCANGTALNGSLKRASVQPRDAVSARGDSRACQNMPPCLPNVRKLWWNVPPARVRLMVNVGGGSDIPWPAVPPQRQGGRTASQSRAPLCRWEHAHPQLR